MGDQPALEASIEIAASPDEVWALVSDLPAMKHASPELVGTRLLGRPGVGRRGLNLNRRKGFVWPTITRITRWKPPVHDRGRGALAFHVWPTDVEWSYELAPAGDGTTTVLTERRTAVVDPSWVVRATARLALGGADSHDREILAGMHRTLAHYRRAADR
ncbi:SRPBCC family protein [Aeromicrobium wangtongii]|uniref:SRPBCC family protein n=1 Tax=Aeromicrobium wangtongii TaxID=2969247 RepID=UPI002016D0A2|nr:SRPBCC family protein [Aeromicrobium wangtongii]MCL3818163.1 SRPBCC family protein [Aeromicrobium wangtongii]